MQKINTYNKLFSAQRLVSQCKHTTHHLMPLVAMKTFTKATTSATTADAAALDPTQYGPSKIDQFQEPRFLEQVKLFFDRAASKTDVPQEYLHVIKACNTVIRFNIPLRRDNGKIETVTCYRYPSFI